MMVSQALIDYICWVEWAKRQRNLSAADKVLLDACMILEMEAKAEREQLSQ